MSLKEGCTTSGIDGWSYWDFSVLWIKYGVDRPKSRVGRAVRHFPLKEVMARRLSNNGQQSHRRKRDTRTPEHPTLLRYQDRAGSFRNFDVHSNAESRCHCAQALFER